MPPPTEFKPKPLVVDSVSSRREFTQCQNCYKGKDRHKIRLSLCTGCHVATYCSTKCQREHWQRHKSVCIHRRAQQQQFAELDEKLLQSPASSNSPSSRILPSQLYTELRAFTKKFNPVLFQAGFNCLHLDTHPATADDFIVFLMLERLSNIPEDYRPWQNLTVRYIGPLRDVMFAETILGGGEEAERFIQIKKEQQHQHITSGNSGTITVVLAATCPGSGIIQNVSCIGFGDHSREALQIGGDWEETFRETIEKMCGRLRQAETVSGNGEVASGQERD